jgi:hypothetical protein
MSINSFCLKGRAWAKPVFHRLIAFLVCDSRKATTFMAMLSDTLREASLYLDLTSFCKVMQVSVTAQTDLVILRSMENFEPHVYDLLKCLVLDENNGISYRPMLSNPVVYLTIGEALAGFPDLSADAFDSTWTQVAIPSGDLLHGMFGGIFPNLDDGEAPYKMWLRECWARHASLPHRPKGCALKEQRRKASKFAITYVTMIRHMQQYESAPVNLLAMEFKWGRVRCRLTAIDRNWIENGAPYAVLDDGSENENSDNEENTLSEEPATSHDGSGSMHGDGTGDSGDL